MNATTRISTAFALSVGLLVWFAGVEASAHSWTDGNKGSKVSTDELIPRMSSGKAYSERYTFAVDFDDGGHVGMDFTISNLGIRNGYGASEVRVYLPDVDDYKQSEKVSRKKWSYDEDSFALDIADAKVTADGDEAFDLEYDGGDVKVELRFERQLPMWRPGNGEIRNDDDYYRFTLVAPRADVTGRIYIDGQWRDVRGTNSGYGDHVATNIAPYNLANRFTRFRSYSDDAFIMWREVDLTDDFGGDRVTWVVVGVGDEIIFEDPDAEVQFGDWERDEETDYHVPHAVQVVSKKGDDRLRFLLRSDDVERRDLLEGRGRAARMIARSVSDPFQYNVRGDYALEVIVGGERLRTKTDGHVTVDYVNH